MMLIQAGCEGSFRFSAASSSSFGPKWDGALMVQAVAAILPVFSWSKIDVDEELPPACMFIFCWYGGGAWNGFCEPARP